MRHSAEGGREERGIVNADNLSINGERFALSYLYSSARNLVLSLLETPNIVGLYPHLSSDLIFMKLSGSII